MKYLFPLIILAAVVFPAESGIAAGPDEQTTSEVTVIPSTQPATTDNGVVVQPPPTIKVTSSAPPGKDPWGITEIVVGIAAILGVISIVGVPALMKIIRDIGDVRAAAREAFAKNESMERKVSEIDATQKGQLLREGTGTGGPPPGAAQ